MIGLNARRQNKVAQVTSGFYNNPYPPKLFLCHIHFAVRDEPHWRSEEGGGIAVIQALKRERVKGSHDAPVICHKTPEVFAIGGDHRRVARVDFSSRARRASGPARPW